MGKKLKASIVVILGVLLVVAFVGCASSNSSAPSEAEVPGDQVKLVTDAYGRVVEVPSTVQSAATVGSGARFVVYAGGQDKLIAVTEMETDPKLHRPYAMAFADLFRSLPATSNGNHLMETSVNTEELINLNPDVIISSRSAEECDQLQETVGIPVIGISYQNQLFTEDVYDSLQCVGEALDTEGHAQQVIAKMQEWDADLKARTATIPADEKPSVYVGALNFKGKKSWGGTYGDYAPCVAVGADNVADQTGQNGAIDVDLEQIATWNPDYIFLDMDNFDLLKKDYDANKAFFDSLRAIQENHLFTQPFFMFNGTNVDTGICDAYFIGATIYPEAFADVDLDARYREIYETMLDGFDFYDVLLEHGQGFTHFPSLD